MFKDKKTKIAVIGSGAAGLASCHFLKNDYEIILLEKSNRFGGHVNTVSIETPCDPKKSIAVDTGFIVCNDLNYPTFNKVLDELDISPVLSDMSFSYSNNSKQIYYSSDFPKGILNSGRNITQKWFWKFLKDLFRFKKVSEYFLLQNNQNQSLAEFLESNNFSQNFIDFYVIPMGAAIWSKSENSTRTYPAYSFLKFWQNHCLFNILNRPQWKTIDGGSVQYANKILDKVSNKFLNTNISKIVRNENHVLIHTDTQVFQVDKVIFACHADEVLPLLENPSPKEISCFEKWKYTKNIAYLHHDPSVMPNEEHLWASWNTNLYEDSLNISYWMNRLQNLDCTTPIFVTLNPSLKISSNKVFKTMNYTHPYFDQHAFQSQNMIQSIQGENNCYYCGSYLGYGFHEDAFKSAQTATRILKEDVSKVLF